MEKHEHIYGFLAYTKWKETAREWNVFMFGKKQSLTEPEKHKHHKKISAEPSYHEPVLARVLTEKLKLSEDIISKAPILMGYGNRRLCIENYSNIIEYTKERIKVQTKTGKIYIFGKNLIIAYFRDDGMCIIGEVKSIEYHD